MQIYLYPDSNSLVELMKRADVTSNNVRGIVKEIYQNVLKNKDEALLNLTKQLDGVALESLTVTESEFNEAKQKISKELKQAISIAKDNITLFHKNQQMLSNVIETTPGVKCWTKNVPIEKVGLYIPGGSAPLFSTVLMLAIPAALAGCEEVILCTPPDSNGAAHPAILYAALECGISSIFKIGGAQAIAAMATGCTSVPKVFKIFGPGNSYVTEAKMQAFEMGVAIDLPAGPSEVMILADETSNPSYIAADMLAQMEHGRDSQAITLVTDQSVAEMILKEYNRLKMGLDRSTIITAAENQSCIIVLPDTSSMIYCMNEYAPEHLIIQTKNPMSIAEKVKNAGSVFVGSYSPESAGDYASGTNHTLPTYGFAKSFSGVNLSSFIKQITFQELTKKGAKNIAPTVLEMARAEGLDAHALAMELRTRTV